MLVMPRRIHLQIEVADDKGDKEGAVPAPTLRTL
jgi:hypothetical protein